MSYYRTLREGGGARDSVIRGRGRGALAEWTLCEALGSSEHAVGLGERNSLRLLALCEGHGGEVHASSRAQPISGPSCLFIDTRAHV